MSRRQRHREPEAGARTYFGWQPEKVAFLFGMSGQRAVMLGAAVLTAVWPLTVSNLSAGLVAWPIAALLAALVFVRMGGRTVDEWATAVASYGSGRWRDKHKFISGPFNPLGRHDRPKPIDLPGVLAPIQILDARMPDGLPVAISYHALDRTYTAVARVRFPSLGLADSSRREHRVSGWGGLLAGLCTEGNPISRVQALQRLVPESAAALRRWHADHLHPDAPAHAVEVTSGLLGTSTLATSQREAYLAFTMDGRRAARQIKNAGGGTAGAAAVLTRHLRALGSAVAGADLRVQEWLGPRDLAEVIRTAFDPDSVQHLSERRAAARRDHSSAVAAGVDPGLAGPTAAESSAGSYTHDGGKSVTYWVHSWPKSHVYSTVLGPLLGEGHHRRSISLHIEPLGPREAEREVMRERTARSAAVRLRQRTGQIIPEHEREALERAQTQDAERASGHGLVRFTGYVTATVTRPDELEDACAALEADAAAAGIALRRMWFAQDIGFAMSALPLGFGLPQRRW
ncbi:lipoprotein [Pilimelia anulata]|uniref:Lipoprotein n=1 Tax=Pilimelia anulata TaxID=53371 RepID=A0A8J3B3A2_9ACTN|nr:SCO6880 family protein [Pilimelia anulata]GGJ75220.1 lipoprotein [Pilimelia anulata]